MAAGVLFIMLMLLIPVFYAVYFPNSRRSYKNIDFFPFLIDGVSWTAAHA